MLLLQTRLGGAGVCPAENGSCVNSTQYVSIVDFEIPSGKMKSAYIVTEVTLRTTCGGGPG